MTATKKTTQRSEKAPAKKAGAKDIPHHPVTPPKPETVKLIGPAQIAVKHILANSRAKVATIQAQLAQARREESMAMQEVLASMGLEGRVVDMTFNDAGAPDFLAFIPKQDDDTGAGAG